MKAHSSHKAFRPRYWMIPAILSDNPRIEPFDEKVYAAIDWFHGMKDGECRASNQTLAELIKPSDPQPRSVQNSLTHLEEEGYIRREYKDQAKRNRLRITPLIELHIERNVGDRPKANETVVIDERSVGDRASEVLVTRVRIESKNRSKKIAEASSAGVFNLKKAIEDMENHPRRDLQIIGLYFSKRMPDFRTKEQMNKAILRHLRPAKALTPFADDQIIKAFNKAKAQTPEWTIETAVKMATK